MIAIGQVLESCDKVFTRNTCNELLEDKTRREALLYLTLDPVKGFTPFDIYAEMIDDRKISEIRGKLRGRLDNME